MSRLCEDLREMRKNKKTAPAIRQKLPEKIKSMLTNPQHTSEKSISTHCELKYHRTKPKENIE